MTLLLLSLVPLLVLSSTADLVAQDIVPPPFVLPTGARVRLSSTSSPGLVRGTLAHGDVMAITIASERGDQITVPIASLTKLEVVVDKRRNTLKGLLLGTAVGLVGGFADKPHPEDCGSSTGNFCSRGESLAYIVPSGALLGAVVGAFIKSDRWTPVSLDALRRPAASTVHGGTASMSFSVTLRF
jgi:hypothetical protein